MSLPDFPNEPSSRRRARSPYRPAGGSSLLPIVLGVGLLGAVVVIAVAGILVIWRSTHSFESPRTDTVNTEKLAHGEKGWFIFAVITLGILALATLAFIPYGDNAKASGQQDVKVVGQPSGRCTPR